MKEKPTVGQIVYSVPTGRFSKDRGIRPEKVKTVGRKYFTLEGHPRTQFHIEDWSENTEYRASFILYKTEQEYHDKIDAEVGALKIRKAFEWGNHHNVPVKVTRKIVGLLDEFLPEDNA